MTTHRLPVKTRIARTTSYGLRALFRALPDAVDTVRTWYRDDRIGRRVDNAVLILIMLVVVFGSGIGAVWFFMRFAA